MKPKVKAKGSSKDEPVLEFFSRHDTPQTPQAIATGIGVKTAKEVNPVLRKLEKDGKVTKVNDSPPLWMIVPAYRQPAGNWQRKTNESAITPSDWKPVQERGEGDVTDRRDARVPSAIVASVQDSNTPPETIGSVPTDTHSAEVPTSSLQMCPPLPGATIDPSQSGETLLQPPTDASQFGPPVLGAVADQSQFGPPLPGTVTGQSQFDSPLPGAVTDPFQSDCQLQPYTTSPLPVSSTSHVAPLLPAAAEHLPQFAPPQIAPPFPTDTRSAIRPNLPRIDMATSQSQNSDISTLQPPPPPPPDEPPPPPPLPQDDPSPDTMTSQYTADMGLNQRGGESDSQQLYGYGHATKPAAAYVQNVYGFKQEAVPTDIHTQPVYGYGHATQQGQLNTQSSYGYEQDSAPRDIHVEDVYNYKQETVPEQITEHISQGYGKESTLSGYGAGRDTALGQVQSAYGYEQDSVPEQGNARTSYDYEQETAPREINPQNSAGSQSTPKRPDIVFGGDMDVDSDDESNSKTKSRDVYTGDNKRIDSCEQYPTGSDFEQPEVRQGRSGPGYDFKQMYDQDPSTVDHIVELMLSENEAPFLSLQYMARSLGLGEALSPVYQAVYRLRKKGVIKPLGERSQQWMLLSREQENMSTSDPGYISPDSIYNKRQADFERAPTDQPPIKKQAFGINNQPDTERNFGNTGSFCPPPSPFELRKRGGGGSVGRDVKFDSMQSTTPNMPSLMSVNAMCTRRDSYESQHNNEFSQKQSNLERFPEHESEQTSYGFEKRLGYGTNTHQSVSQVERQRREQEYKRHIAESRSTAPGKSFSTGSKGISTKSKLYTNSSGGPPLPPKALIGGNSNNAPTPRPLMGHFSSGKMGNLSQEMGQSHFDEGGDMMRPNMGHRPQRMGQSDFDDGGDMMRPNMGHGPQKVGQPDFDDGGDMMRPNMGHRPQKMGQSDFSDSRNMMRPGPDMDTSDWHNTQKPPPLMAQPIARPQSSNASDRMLMPPNQSANTPNFEQGIDNISQRRNVPGVQQTDRFDSNADRVQNQNAGNRKSGITSGKSGFRANLHNSLTPEEKRKAEEEYKRQIAQSRGSSSTTAFNITNKGTSTNSKLYTNSGCGPPLPPRALVRRGSIPEDAASKKSRFDNYQETPNRNFQSQNSPKVQHGDRIMMPQPHFNKNIPPPLLGQKAFGEGNVPGGNFNQQGPNSRQETFSDTNFNRSNMGGNVPKPLIEQPFSKAYAQSEGGRQHHQFPGSTQSDAFGKGLNRPFGGLSNSGGNGPKPLLDQPFAKPGGNAPKSLLDQPFAKPGGNAPKSLLDQPFSKPGGNAPKSLLDQPFSKRYSQNEGGHQHEQFHGQNEGEAFGVGLRTPAGGQDHSGGNAPQPLMDKPFAKRFLDREGGTQDKQFPGQNQDQAFGRGLSKSEQFSRNKPIMVKKSGFRANLHTNLTSDEQRRKEEEYKSHIAQSRGSVSDRSFSTTSTGTSTKSKLYGHSSRPPPPPKAVVRGQSGPGAGSNCRLNQEPSNIDTDHAFQGQPFGQSSGRAFGQSNRPSRFAPPSLHSQPRDMGFGEANQRPMMGLGDGHFKQNVPQNRPSRFANTCEISPGQPHRFNAPPQRPSPNQSQGNFGGPSQAVDINLDIEQMKESQLHLEEKLKQLENFQSRRKRWDNPDPSPNRFPNANVENAPGARISDACNEARNLQPRGTGFKKSGFRSNLHNSLSPEQRRKAEEEYKRQIAQSRGSASTPSFSTTNQGTSTRSKLYTNSSGGPPPPPRALIKR